MTMTIWDRMLNRDAETIARKQAMREFKGTMPRKGSFSELERSRLTGYYDRRFGDFDALLDSWRDGEADVLKANPALRRLDVITDSLFKAGVFELRGVGDVRSKDGEAGGEGTIAAISVISRGRTVTGMLTLDIGGEVKYTKLRLYAEGTEGFVIRVSTLDHGMVIQPRLPESKRLPETIHERAAGGSEVFQTLSETLAGMERLLGKYL